MEDLNTISNYVRVKHVSVDNIVSYSITKFVFGWRVTYYNRQSSDQVEIKFKKRPPDKFRVGEGLVWL